MYSVLGYFSIFNVRLFPFLSIFLVHCNSSINSVIDQRPSADSIYAWKNHLNLVSKISKYHALGSFYYISIEKKIYFRFNWTQKNVDYSHIFIINPFGLTDITIISKYNIMKILENKKKIYITDNPDIIFSKFIGIKIPFKYLKKWIIGLPGENNKFFFDNLGLLRTVYYKDIDNGKILTVKYISYHDNIIPKLPAAIYIQHGTNSVTLKIEKWNL